MISFKEYFIEGKQVGVLYHYTTLEYLFSIIATNRLGKHYSTYVCFTRNKYFHKQGHDIGGDACRFVVDGDKLSHNYKIIPYNDLTIQPSTKQGKEGYRHDRIVDEQEERIYKIIDNFNRYIIKLQILQGRLNDFFEDDTQTFYTGTKYLDLTKDEFLDYIRKYCIVEII